MWEGSEMRGGGGGEMWEGRGDVGERGRDERGEMR